MNHKELKAWQRAMDLVTEVYAITSNFPSEEKFGLTNQIRRSAVSIPSNIAEGAGRESSSEYLRFLTIALGSLSELETQLLISIRLKYLKSEKVWTILKETRKLLIGIKKYLNSINL